MTKPPERVSWDRLNHRFPPKTGAFFMARQRAHSPVSRNSGSDFRLQIPAVSEELSPDDIDRDLPEKQAEEQPVFIARMPNLEKPHSSCIADASLSVWNRIRELKNGITDRQQIISLWCIIAFLVCMLFWNMVSKPLPDSPDLAQTAVENSLRLDHEPYRSERSASSRSEIAFEHLSSRGSSVPSEREWNHDELAPVLPTTSIILSESPEETLYEVSPSPAQHSTTVQTRSAWDRDVYSAPLAVSSPAPSANVWDSNSVSANPVSASDMTPDFSAFTTPSYGTTSPQTAQAGGEFSVNRYSEPQVQQVQYYQNTTTQPNYGGQPVQNFSQGNSQYPVNTHPGTGAYQPQQMPQTSASYGQPNNFGTNFNATAQYPAYAQQGQQPNPVGHNAASYREEIPATYSNNTYRNPGAPQAMVPNGNYQQGGTGQYNPNPPGVPQHNQPTFNLPTYGTAVYPANTLNR